MKKRKKAAVIILPYISVCQPPWLSELLSLPTLLLSIWIKAAINCMHKHPFFFFVIFLSFVLLFILFMFCPFSHSKQPRMWILFFHTQTSTILILTIILMTKAPTALWSLSKVSAVELKFCKNSKKATRKKITTKSLY